MIKIKKFELFATTIITKTNANLTWKRGLLGEAQYEPALIEIQEVNGNIEWSPSDYERCYLHEVVHHILNVMSEDQLVKNERFVDIFARCMHQFLKTAVFEIGDNTASLDELIDNFQKTL